jgi:hypothetical protein
MFVPWCALSVSLHRCINMIKFIFKHLRKAFVKSHYWHSGFVISFCLSIRLSVLMENLEAYLRDFCEISYMGFILKFIVTFQFWLNWEECSVHFIRKPKYIYIISPWVVFKTGTDWFLCQITAEADHNLSTQVREIFHFAVNETTILLGYSEILYCV